MEHSFCLHCMNPSSEEVCSVCGKNRNEYVAAPHHLQPGAILAGKYIVGAVLGEGGFGITYIGRDINLDIKVAIKEYFPSGVVNRNNTSSSEITAHVGDAQNFFEKGKNSFLGEARTLAKFSNEPSVVSVRDFFSENNTAYIVMEYLEGIDLKEYLNQHGNISFEQTVTMLTPIMKALSKIHAQGLIHRDISPANIMILKDGTVKLLDFGAAREVSGADEKSLSILLKPGFAPEEQYRTKGHQGPWTDVYALSATMYKMLTGVTPVDAMNRVFSDDLSKITALNPAVTPVQEAVIFKGMAVLQQNRYQSIDELCADCQSALINTAQDEKTVAGNFAPSQPVYQQPQQPVYQQPQQPVYQQPQQPVYQQPQQPVYQQPQQPVYQQPQQPVYQQPQQPVYQPVKADDSIIGNKKPNIAAFIGSIITGILTLLMIFTTASTIISEESWISFAILTIVFAVPTFFLGRLYFPRIDNKKRKPNLFCLIAGIISSLLTVFLAWLTYVNFTDAWAEEGAGETSAVLTVLSLALPVFFGYFYYPRLERKKRNIALKIYGGIAAGAVALLVISIISTTLNTITIGDKNFKRNETNISLSLDVVTNNDISKLKEFKKLESLEVFECFLDDEDIKVIGELTNLKQLSISTNTDVTDITPLANLKDLTYLDIGNTKVSDISCLAGLTKMKTLIISGTNVSDLSVISNFTELEKLNINSMESLDYSTIQMPSTVESLECNDSKVTDLSFVSGSDNLLYFYASNNEITDLTPLSKFNLYNLNLSNNKITDISPINFESIYDLNMSSNLITDISPLKTITAFKINLSYNQISDLSAFTDNSRVGVLDLNHNAISDISPLKDCFKISSLDVSYNQIVDISAISTIDNLNIFNARNNKIVDISPMASCQNLTKTDNAIDLSNNEITSIQAISEFTNTTQIFLSNNKISDISPLRNCAALEILKLNNNQVTDISPLKDLHELYIFEIVDNPISDVSAINLNAQNSTILGKAIFRLSYNENINFEALSQIENLNVTFYDVPPRKQDEISKMGFSTRSDKSELEDDEQEEDNG